MCSDHMVWKKERWKNSMCCEGSVIIDLLDSDQHQGDSLFAIGVASLHVRMDMPSETAHLPAEMLNDFSGSVFFSEILNKSEFVACIDFF